MPEHCEQAQSLRTLSQATHQCVALRPRPASAVQGDCVTSVINLIGELPIPLGLEYQRRSARPDAAQVKVATQEGDFAAEPLMRKFGAVQKEVPYSEYRMLRWTLGQLLAGAKTTVSARTSVETYVAPSSGILAPIPPVPAVSTPTTVKP